MRERRPGWRGHGRRLWRSGSGMFLLAAFAVTVAPTWVAGQIVMAGQVTFLNSCAVNFTLVSNGRPLARLGPNAGQFEHQNLVPGTRYFYRLCAADKAATCRRAPSGPRSPDKT